MAKSVSSKSASDGESPSKQIDAKIKQLADWRGKTLAKIRALIKEADPDVVEEWKVARRSGLGTCRDHLHR